MLRIMKQKAKGCGKMQKAETDKNRFTAYTSPGILQDGGSVADGYEITALNCDGTVRKEEVTSQEYAVWAACHGTAVSRQAVHESSDGIASLGEPADSVIDGLIKRGLIVTGSGSSHSAACMDALKKLYLFPLVWENRNLISPESGLSATLLSHRFMKHLLPRDEKELLNFLSGGAACTLRKFCEEHGDGEDVRSAVTDLIGKCYLLPCGLDTGR